MINNISLLVRMERLEQKTALDDWDGELGLAIPSSLWTIARKVVVSTELPSPYYFGPCGDGTIHIEWRWSNCRFLLELGSTSWEWSYTKESETTFTESETTYNYSDNLEDALEVLKGYISIDCQNGRGGDSDKK